MAFYEREDQILRILLERQTMGNQELAKRLYISLPTLRRDLAKLEEKGLIVRSHGACSLNRQAADEKIPLHYREQKQSSEKIRIAKKAVDFIKDGDVIMLDASTSAYHITPLLTRFQDLIVITSGAKTSCMLGSMSIKNISTGGRMITKSLSYVGPDALDTIRNYYADIAFFSCRGIADDGRVTDNSVEENEVRREMSRHAARKVLLCDSSKLGHSCYHTLCHISEVDAVLCETPLPEHLARLLP